MLHRLFSAGLLRAGLCGLMLFQGEAKAQACACDANAPAVFQLLDGTPAHQQWIRAHSDQFSWMVLLEISKTMPSAFQTAVKGGRTNNVEWETWADDDFTFPRNPQPGSPPLWRDRRKLTHAGKALHQDPLQQLLEANANQERSATHNLRLAQVPPITEPAPNGVVEEVRRNRPSLEFITSNHLWYQDGLIAYAKKGITMDFPSRAMEIKAEWQRVDSTETFPYHRNFTQDGTAYKLVALHISTKALPEWTWATFEWAGNAGRCNSTGCRDTFGQTPSFTTPIRADVRPYTPEKLCPNLLERMQKVGINVDEWRGYRLKGSQVLIGNPPRPSPSRLGNSQIERTLVPNSSCLACHLRARVYRTNGTPDCKLGMTNTGIKDPAGYTDYMTPERLAQREPNYYLNDFVWAFFKASSLNSGAPTSCAPDQSSSGSR